jgi:exosome complex RNA-binding protein Rrp4
MTTNVTVDCTIGRNGRVWIKRIKLDDAWLNVEQGRQWQDEDGRHVLVMRPGGQVEELLLSSQSLRWELVPRRNNPQIV